jgi:hypothetical protein
LNPSKTIAVVCIGTRQLAADPTCDPAIDLDFQPTEDNPGTLAERLSAYERSRSAEDLARLPLRHGALPVRFEVQPLTAEHRAWVSGGRNDEEMAQRAFRACCHRYVDETDKVREVKVPRDEYGAPQSWLESVTDAYGADAFREVAKVALDRSNAGPRALRPFALPHGLMLPR